MDIVIRPRKFAFVLAALVAFLTAANVLGGMYVYLSGASQTPLLVKLFHFDHEQTIPAFFQSVLLLFCGVLLLLIAVMRRPDLFYYWIALGGIFVFLAVDEATSIHENLIVVVREGLGTSGLLHSAWVIPYVLALIPLGLIYLRFLFRLPAFTRNLFVLAAAIYLTGAVGLEMVGAYFYEWGGLRTFRYQITMTAEELLEMIGIGVFVFALMHYMAGACGGAGIRFLSR